MRPARRGVTALVSLVHALDFGWVKWPSTALWAN